MACVFFFFKQKTAYEMRISDWSSDVCSSDLTPRGAPGAAFGLTRATCGAPVVNSRHGEGNGKDPLQDEAVAPGEPEGRRMDIPGPAGKRQREADRKSTRLNSSH